MLSLLGLLALQAVAQEPTALEIVTRSVQADRNNLRKAKDYSYIERHEQRRIGGVESRTYDVVILDGSPYRRLIARDDKPLTEKEARKVSEDLDRTRRKRLQESDADRRRRLAREEKQSQQSRLFLAEIPSAFELKLRGVEAVSGVPAWVIDAQPRPGFQSKVKNSEMLKKFRGRLWIEQRTYQWVKVEAESLDRIWLGLVLARLDKGATLGFEQTLVNGELWLPKRMSARANARLGLIKKLSVLPCAVHDAGVSRAPATECSLEPQLPRISPGRIKTMGVTLNRATAASEPKGWSADERTHLSEWDSVPKLTIPCGIIDGAAYDLSSATPESSPRRTSLVEHQGGVSSPGRATAQ
ncbi:MAG: hypothetical protein HZB13_18100 [Acidobacteria bacterium]|nr:hypothetical protein [Acidobacteriota bacterium]